MNDLEMLEWAGLGIAMGNAPEVVQQGLDIKLGEFLLFKTRNSWQDVFDPCFVYLAESAARYLAEKRMRGIGWDALSIERAQPGHPSHRVLLEQGIVILEGLRLKEVEPGEYSLIALPLPVWGAEAAPVRVLLWKEYTTVEPGPPEFSKEGRT